MRRALFFLSLFAVLLTAHLLHSGVLWAEETLPLAAALQMKRGLLLYRDIWFDKPPLVAAFCLLWGAHTGAMLRIAGALYCFAACALAFATAERMWSKREGYLAASLLAFFLTFDTHSSVVPLAADLLLLVPHLAAIFFAATRRALPAGVAAGIGFLVNAKALFVLLACALFVSPGGLPSLTAGFVAVTATALAGLKFSGALPAFIDQAWRWPALYAASPLESNPFTNGALRTANWLGFHAALVIGAVAFWLRERTLRIPAWILIAYAGVALGGRFFPRYFFLLLPPLIFAAARGLAQSRSRFITALTIAALAVPAVRFTPRYFQLDNWSDLALDRDSRQAAQRIASLTTPAATLYVWGYRPELFVYTQRRPATRYLDSQALTGVPADRHLTQSTVVLTEGVHEARRTLAASRPDIIADCLTLYNSSLSMNRYPELQPLLTEYREAARTAGTIIYLRR